MPPIVVSLLACYRVVTFFYSGRETQPQLVCFRLDLASFVTTWMEPEAEEIIAATQAINMVDVSQYPQCAEMEQRSESLYPSALSVHDTDPFCTYMLTYVPSI